MFFAEYAKQSIVYVLPEVNSSFNLNALLEPKLFSKKANVLHTNFLGFPLVASLNSWQ